MAVARGLGLKLKSCEGEVEVVQKALAHGLFCNAVRFETTTYSATEKHHTGTDVYRLVHEAGPGAAPLSNSFKGDGGFEDARCHVCIEGCCLVGHRISVPS